jgi:hypothetical protein
MTLTATTGTYIHPFTHGEYPNAYITYQGDRHNLERKEFIFKFNLLNENNYVVSTFYWEFKGNTASGNTIQDHGEIIISANTSGETATDFIAVTTNGDDYDDPQFLITRLPSLSYDDIDSYFILGNKKEKTQLPAGANPKKLIKWLFLNSIVLNGELLKEQFNF